MVRYRSSIPSTENNEQFPISIRIWMKLVQPLHVHIYKELVDGAAVREYIFWWDSAKRSLDASRSENNIVVSSDCSNEINLIGCSLLLLHGHVNVNTWL